MIFMKDLRFQFFFKKNLEWFWFWFWFRFHNKKNKIVNLKSGFGSGSWKNILKFQF